MSESVSLTVSISAESILQALKLTQKNLSSAVAIWSTSLSKHSDLATKRFNVKKTRQISEPTADNSSNPS
jgi:hypothetical protein